MYTLRFIHKTVGSTFAKVILQVAFFVITLGILLVSCNRESEISITKKYIYNEKWGTSKLHPTDFFISRLNNKDSILKYDSKIKGFGIYNYILSGRIKIDSSFRYYIKPESANNIKRVYFDKQQDSVVFGKFGSKNSFKTIGELKKECWYRFTGIKSHTDFYTYIDSNGSEHMWEVMYGNF